MQQGITVMFFSFICRDALAKSLKQRVTTIMPNTRRNTEKGEESIHLHSKSQANNFTKNLDQGTACETNNGMSRGSTVINNIDTLSSNTVKLSKDQHQPVTV